MRYTTLLFDLDHTLFDFDASEDAAFADTFARAGIVNPNGHRRVFGEINAALWLRVERGELTPNRVGTLRFEQLVERLGIDADPHVMADDYVTGLGANGDLFPGARDLLEELAPHATLALVSNGIGAVARAKVARLDLDPYFEAIVISGEVGTAKPDAGIFDIVFDQLGNPDKATALMIGDSLSSDIAGGINYGIDTCWYAPFAPETASSEATYRVGSFEEIPSVVART
ncbi:MAG: YjjG family noncanonical pyrimidine nucleotidase, partial [Acidimicrobiia bacterium]|nr:YjjG family noncanonical pyrimidine nucleotidase [Acidimicrobiia bacterium]